MVFVWVVVFAFSIAILVKGADFLLGSAKKIGEWLGFSAFTIGVVIVGFGTSAPELVASISAQLQGASDIIAGNVAGSNIVNVLLIAALAAVVSRGTTMKLEDETFDVAWLIASALIFFVVIFDGVISVGESLFILLGLFVYSVAIYAFTSDNRALVPEMNRIHRPSSRDFALLFLGLALLSVGAHFTVKAAVNTAELLQIGTGVIGLLAIALGTSLPELAVTIRAARAKDVNIAIGNIFGSNVFNILAIVGIPGLFGVIFVDSITLVFGSFFMLVATVVLAYAGYKKYFSIQLGFFALIAYGCFLILVTIFA